MKKIVKVFSVTLSLLLLLTTLTVAASAATDWSTVKPEEYILVMNTYVATSDTLLDYGQNTMRGFTISPDGKYAFGGFLNPGNTSAVAMFDLATALPVGYYTHDQADGSRSYPKGLAADDRGNLYVGLAYYPNYGEADFAVVKYNTGDMTELSVTNILTIGTPGDKSGTKIGINGTDVQKLGDKYYCYIVINYEVDFLYRYDVTDPSKPVLDTTFGTDGRVDLAGKHSFTEGQYLDVDTDGTIYIGATTSSGSGMYVLSEDGNTLLNSFSCSKGYAVGLWEDFIFVTTQSGPTCIHVLDKINLSEIATIAGHDGANSYVYVAVANDILYIGDQGAGASDYDGVIVAPLSADAAAQITARKAAFEAALATTVADTTAKPVETTQAADTTKAAEADTTKSAADTTAKSAADTTKADDVKKSGCGSVIAFCALIPAAFVPAILLRRKKD